MHVLPERRPHLVTLMFVSGFSLASLNMFLPSLQSVASGFNVDYARVSLTIAGYALVAAALQLIIGPLSDRYGRRPVILTGLAIFTFASAGCLLATDFATFLYFRMLQAVVITGATVSRAVVMDSYGPRKAAGVMGYIAMVWALAPMLAPMFGGVLDDLFGWRANFWAFFSIGFALFVLCWFDFNETNMNPSETMLKQVRTYPQLLRSGAFWGYSLCTALSIGSFFAYLSSLPLVASTVYGISTAKLGFYISCPTAGFMLGSFISGRIAAQYSLTRMMIAGRLVSCGGMTAGLLLLSAGLLYEPLLVACSACIGIGNGLTTASSNVGTMAVQPHLAGSASGISGSLTNAAGAAVTVITGAIITTENAPFVMLGMTLAVSLLALASALYVRWGTGEARGRRLAAAQSPD